MSIITAFFHLKYFRMIIRLQPEIIKPEVCVQIMSSKEGDQNLMSSLEVLQPSIYIHELAEQVLTNKKVPVPSILRNTGYASCICIYSMKCCPSETEIKCNKINQTAFDGQPIRPLVYSNLPSIHLRKLGVIRSDEKRGVLHGDKIKSGISHQERSWWKEYRTLFWINLTVINCSGSCCRSAYSWLQRQHSRATKKHN